MKQTIMQWLGLDTPEAPKDTHHINEAAAALMVEVMLADNEWDSTEQDTIEQLIHTELGVSKAHIAELIDTAKQKQRDATDLYQFTQVVNTEYSATQKFDLLVQLWRVAYADGSVDRYEEHMIRKLADLLRIAHSGFIQAKLAAKPKP